MPELPRKVGVALDLAGCPNRCRHCYLGTGPNRPMSTDDLRAVAKAFTAWKRPGGSAAYFDEVWVSSWYREPDFRDDYREMHELEHALSRGEPERYELLSVWRLAQDEGYAGWASGIGPRTCQITLFGLPPPIVGALGLPSLSTGT